MKKRERYKPLFEGKKTDLLDQAEDYLNQNKPYIAVKYIANSIGKTIKNKHDSQISGQVDEYLKKNSVTNNYTFISNIQKILSDVSDDKLIKYKTIRQRQTKQNNKEIDQAVQKAMLVKQIDDVDDVDDNNEKEKN